MQFGLFALRNFIFCSYGKLARNSAVAIATVSVILLGAIGQRSIERHCGRANRNCSRRCDTGTCH